MTAGFQSRSGRRAFAATAVVALALTSLLISALRVQAGEKGYEGSVPGTQGKIDFVLKRNHGKLTIKEFHATLPNTTPCQGTVNFVLHTVKVNRKRRFHVEKFIQQARYIDAAYLNGRLGKGGRASGTVRYILGFDEVPVCDTGTLEWRAHRTG
jgi:hypothetical protein